MKSLSSSFKVRSISNFNNSQNRHLNFKIRGHLFLHKIRQYTQFLQQWKNTIRRSTDKQLQNYNLILIKKNSQNLLKKIIHQITNLAVVKIPDHQIHNFSGKIWVAIDQLLNNYNYVQQLKDMKVLKEANNQICSDIINICQLTIKWLLQQIKYRSMYSRICLLYIFAQISKIKEQKTTNYDIYEEIVSILSSSNYEIPTKSYISLKSSLNYCILCSNEQNCRYYLGLAMKKLRKLLKKTLIFSKQQVSSAIQSKMIEINNQQDKKQQVKLYDFDEATPKMYLLLFYQMCMLHNSRTNDNSYINIQRNIKIMASQLNDKKLQTQLQKIQQKYLKNRQTHKNRFTNTNNIKKCANYSNKNKQNYTKQRSISQIVPKASLQTSLQSKQNTKLQQQSQNSHNQFLNTTCFNINKIRNMGKGSVILNTKTKIISQNVKKQFVKKLKMKNMNINRNYSIKKQENQCNNATIILSSQLDELNRDFQMCNQKIEEDYAFQYQQMKVCQEFKGADNIQQIQKNSEKQKNSEQQQNSELQQNSEQQQNNQQNNTIKSENSISESIKNIIINNQYQLIVSQIIQKHQIEHKILLQQLIAENIQQVINQIVNKYCKKPRLSLKVYSPVKNVVSQAQFDCHRLQKLNISSILPSNFYQQNQSNLLENSVMSWKTIQSADVVSSQSSSPNLTVLQQLQTITIQKKDLILKIMTDSHTKNIPLFYTIEQNIQDSTQILIKVMQKDQLDIRANRNIAYLKNITNQQKKQIFSNAQIIIGNIVTVDQRSFNEYSVHIKTNYIKQIFQLLKIL